MQNIKEAALQFSGQLTEWRRALHQIPESGLICPQTAAYICARLEEMGISWQSYERHSGIVAVIGKGPGPVIGLRADMDGLDVQEENALAYASKNGRMHACGHDAHTAMLLGTARLLKEREDQLRGRVKLIFQPDEEGLNGAKLMVEDGVLDDPKVDLMYAMHVGSILGQGAHPGQLFWKQGAVFASSDNFRITIRGKGGHASTPFLAKNPIQAAAQIIENFGSLAARSVNYNVPTVLTITGITGGNGAHNIIPGETEIVGGVRTQDAAVREDLMRKMRGGGADLLKRLSADGQRPGGYGTLYPLREKDPVAGGCGQIRTVVHGRRGCVLLLFPGAGLLYLPLQSLPVGRR